MKSPKHNNYFYKYHACTFSFNHLSLPSLSLPKCSTIFWGRSRVITEFFRLAFSSYSLYFFKSKSQLNMLSCHDEPLNTQPVIRSFNPIISGLCFASCDRGWPPGAPFYNMKIAGGTATKWTHHISMATI